MWDGKPSSQFMEFQKLETGLLCDFTTGNRTPRFRHSQVRERVIRVPLNQKWIETSFSLGTNFFFCAFSNLMLLLFLLQPSPHSGGKVRNTNGQFGKSKWEDKVRKGRTINASILVKVKFTPSFIQQIFLGGLLSLRYFLIPLSHYEL